MEIEVAQPEVELNLLVPGVNEHGQDQPVDVFSHQEFLDYLDNINNAEANGDAAVENGGEAEAVAEVINEGGAEGEAAQQVVEAAPQRPLQRPRIQDRPGATVEVRRDFRKGLSTLRKGLQEKKGLQIEKFYTRKGLQ
ncbi:unnamed protein product [Bursaphelenchus okinawaensis]|uniref:Uncharacterized protein n=1 Tax=Bursaphelenchus okinawaensis TaxID=465554 RepID=A0A811JQY2_9BILA|nr:unnamed protein product [Bursaphelenchus okinawaensis]CAG9078929.1 unnamed protein product [Bursaphelenchus okinawaensis]